MRSIVASIAALLLGTAIILLGNGLQGTLLGVRGTVEGFSGEVMGTIMAAYFVGFVAGSVLVVHLIDRVGHIRAFAALAAVASAAALTHVLFVAPVAWGLLRAISGFCFAGLAMIIESWLNDRVPNARRGQVFALYMVVNLLAIAFGQLLLTVADPAGFVLFCLVSILLTLSLVPIATTRSAAPVPSPVKAMALGSLVRTSPLGIAACIGSGMGTGAFWGLGAVFAQRIGLGIDDIALFMFATVFGGLLLQWPIGWLSDRFDRRMILTVVLFATAAVALTIALLGGATGHGLIVLSALFGGGAFVIYPLAVAHVNDHAPTDQMVRISSALLLIFGAGAAIGPIAAGVLMSRIGPSALYLFIALVLAAVGAFALYRMRQRSSPPLDEQAPFVPASVSTPAAIALDPRAPDSDPLPHPAEASWRGS